MAASFEIIYNQILFLSMSSSQPLTHLIILTVIASSSKYLISNKMPQIPTLCQYVTLKVPNSQLD